MPAEDAEGRKKLAGTMLRAAMSLEKRTYDAVTGTVIYRSKMHLGLKRNFQVMPGAEQLALAEAAIYLAVAPKSNAAYSAYGSARALIRDDKSRPVPEHLRNAPTRLMKELGYGRDYRYAHDEPDAYAAGENYFPEGMPPPRLYEPTERGLEAKIKARLGELRALDAKARNRK